MGDMPEATKAQRKGGRPRRSERNDVAARVDRAIVNKAKAIAVHRGLVGGAAEVLSDLARGPVNEAYARMLRELDAG